jgi:hypothetical protein
VTVAMAAEFADDLKTLMKAAESAQSTSKTVAEFAAMKAKVEAMTAAAAQGALAAAPMTRAEDLEATKRAVASAAASKAPTSAADLTKALAAAAAAGGKQTSDTTTATELARKLAELENVARQEVEAAKEAVRVQEEEAAMRRAEVQAQVQAYEGKETKEAALRRLTEEKQRQLQVRICEGLLPPSPKPWGDGVRMFGDRDVFCSETRW